MDIKKLVRIADSAGKEVESTSWDKDEHRWISRKVQLGDYVRWKDLEVGKEYYFRYGRAFDNQVHNIKVYLKSDNRLVGLRIPQFQKAPKWVRDVVKNHTNINWFFFEDREPEEDHKLMKQIIEKANFDDWKKNTVDKYTSSDILHAIDDYVEFFVKDPSKESIKERWGEGYTGKFYEIKQSE